MGWGAFSALLGEQRRSAFEVLDLPFEKLDRLLETGDAGQGRGEFALQGRHLLGQLLVGRRRGRLGRGHDDRAGERDVVTVTDEVAEGQIAELTGADLVHDLLFHCVENGTPYFLAQDAIRIPLPKGVDVPPDRVAEDAFAEIAPLPKHRIQLLHGHPLEGSARGLLDAQDHETLAPPIAAGEILPGELGHVDRQG